MSILKLSSDSLTSPAVVGQIEYDGTIFAATPNATQRGVIPTEQFFRLNANLAGANATGAQSIFGVGVTLAASTVYEFEMFFVIGKTSGTTAHDVSLLYGGTATFNNALLTYNPAFSEGNALNSGVVLVSQTPSSAMLTSTSVTGTYYIKIVSKGTLSVNASGTFIPQYSLSAAPGGAYSTLAGSYIKIKPIGAAGANVNVGTWA